MNAKPITMTHLSLQAKISVKRNLRSFSKKACCRANTDHNVFPNWLGNCTKEPSSKRCLCIGK